MFIFWFGCWRGGEWRRECDTLVRFKVRKGVSDLGILGCRREDTSVRGEVDPVTPRG